ncbi:MAG: hypothetical protein KDI12_24150 [Anaerolineae bacterium]|nr:hypothetical protein [Anaerolineae bacterium]
MNQTYGKTTARQRVGVNRAAFDAYHMPHLTEWGIAQEVAPRIWAFAEPDFTHYAEYVAAVRERKEAGTLPGNYQYNEWDMECCASGEWDDEEFGG